MSKKKAPYHLVIGNKIYGLNELSETLSVSEGTIRVSWRNMGLMPIALNRQPLLYSGHEVKSFLKSLYDKRKLNNLATEFFCMKCNTSRKAKNGAFQEYKDSRGNRSIRCKCEVCEFEISKKNISQNTLDILKKVYPKVPPQEASIYKTQRPSDKSRIQGVKIEGKKDSYLETPPADAEDSTTSGDKSRIQTVQGDLFEGN